MAAARPRIDTHLLMCYYAIFEVGTMHAIDPSSILGDLLLEWKRFERGHFAGGRRIITLTDFRDNFPYILELFRTHDFFREYHSRYSLHTQYQRTPSRHAAARLAGDRLRLLHSLLVHDGPVHVDTMIGNFLALNPNDLQAAGRVFNVYLTLHDYRTPFNDVSGAVNRQLDFDDEEILRYDNTSQENAPPQTPHTQHARLTLLLSQLAALHEP